MAHTVGISLYARRMPRKVVSGPDYDDEYDDYDEYDDDYDDYDETGHGDIQHPVKEEKGMLFKLLLNCVHISCNEGGITICAAFFYNSVGC